LTPIAVLARSLLSRQPVAEPPAPLFEQQTLQAQTAALERLAACNDAPAVLQQLRVTVSDYEQDEAAESTLTSVSA